MASVAKALIGAEAELSPRERQFNVGADLLANLRAAIRADGDPLGDEFCRLRPVAQRRRRGATYTPPAIVAAMADWASRQDVAPARIVDPGAGSGRFLWRTARAFPAARLVAIEADPLAALLLRANAAVLGVADRLDLHVADYTELDLPPATGPTLFIGNPPYLRHHAIGQERKAWFAACARAHGVRASRLAGLHVHFFAKTLDLARPGDFGAFVTAAEWLDVNYGSVLRQMLAGALGGLAVHVFDPDIRAFADAMVTAAIACFQLGAPGDSMVFRRVRSMDVLDLGSSDLAKGGSAVPRAAARATPRWSAFLRQSARAPPGWIEIGEVFRVHRGQVTGGNRIWIAGAGETRIPPRFQIAAITKARELLAAGDALESIVNLRRVIDLPADLDGLDESERRQIRAFLAWARRQGGDRGYIARARRCWWSVGLRAPAPILCTYMARQAPVFVRNRAAAAHLNIAHGLYPRAPISPAVLDAIGAFLHGRRDGTGGRVYAGGLIKFEPGEIARLLMPRPERLPVEGR